VTRPVATGANHLGQQIEQHVTRRVCQLFRC
jgi:hypothetical protein